MRLFFSPGIAPTACCRSSSAAMSSAAPPAWSSTTRRPQSTRFAQPVIASEEAERYPEDGDWGAGAIGVELSELL